MAHNSPSSSSDSSSNSSSSSFELVAGFPPQAIGDDADGQTLEAARLVNSRITQRLLKQAPAAGEE